MEPRYMKIKEKTSLYGRVFDLSIGHFTLFWPSLYGNPFQNLAIWKGLQPIGHFTLFWPSLYGNPFQNFAIWNKFSIPEAFHIARFDCIRFPCNNFLNATFIENK